MSTENAQYFNQLNDLDGSVVWVWLDCWFAGRSDGIFFVFERNGMTTDQEVCWIRCSQMVEKIFLTEPQ